MKRHTDVLGIIPNTSAVILLIGGVLAEQHEEWRVTRHYLIMEFRTKLAEEVDTTAPPALAAVR